MRRQADESSQRRNAGSLMTGNLNFALAASDIAPCAFSLWTRRVKLIAGIDDLDAEQRSASYVAFCEGRAARAFACEIVDAARARGTARPWSR